MKIKKDDQVKILSGRDAGKTGKVQQVFPKHSKIIVEGTNMVSKHMKANQDMRQASIITKEASIDISKVKLMCPKCSKAIKVKYTLLEDGKKVRICNLCNEMVDQ